MRRVVIPTRRFVLRSLRVEDATPRYSAWFSDADTSRHIVFARGSHDIEALRSYIAERSGRRDVLFLGIFTRDRREHIGNIKYEPVDFARRLAVMGILIGERRWRGLGVAAEVIAASARWLGRAHGIRQIVLGVDRNYRPAIHAYRKLGFRRGVSPFVAVDSKVAVTMIWQLPS